MFNLNNKNKGFTLIEIIVAILVVTVGVLAAYIVTQEIISYTHRISSRLTASYLAKEGIEIVRNIRDTNWIQSVQGSKGLEDWDAGLNAGDYEVDYVTITLAGSTYENCDAYSDCKSFVGTGTFLKIVDGFYKYSSFGTETKFKRKITITPEGIDKLIVSVEITWTEKGTDYGPVTVQEILYDWNPF